MINYTNIQKHINIPFDEYLKFNGYSHSFLKREKNGITPELTITENIIIGKLVDGILTEPQYVEMANPLYPVAKLIAYEISKNFGDLIKHFEKQISYTSLMQYGDFIMPAKVRLDFMLTGHAAIEMKITKSKDIDGIIKHMGYENQLWHQTKMAGVNKGYFLFHSIPLKKTIILTANCDSDHNDFWAEKIISFGTVNS